MMTKNNKNNLLHTVSTYGKLIKYLHFGTVIFVRHFDIPKHIF